MRQEASVACLAFMLAAFAAAAATVTVDCSATNGMVRAIHSCNGGAIAYGGMVDLTAVYREAGFPLVRLHDCQWPEPAVVDIHTIFRDFRDDPSVAENYYFLRTDDYLQAILKAGCGIYYRLGESIEHTQRRYDVHPPADYRKWAEICLGIIRHYNEGWAAGFRHNIRYWEIWNEPEVRPQMWSGSDEDYYRLYEISAKAIKARFPEVKVGGPGAANAGDLSGDSFRLAPFLDRFLQRCKSNGVPVDFLSWHCYTDDPRELVLRSEGVRKALDDRGFEHTESHLNEWNYLPGKDWNVFATGTPQQRSAWYEAMGGPAGAAFIAASLLALQDAPVDMTFLYSGDIQGFGVFDTFGSPKTSFSGVKAFRRLLDSPVRVRAGTDSNEQVVCAGMNADNSAMTLVIARLRGKGPVKIDVRKLPFAVPAECSVTTADKASAWKTGQVRLTPVEERNATLEIDCEAPAVIVVQIRQSRARNDRSH